METNLKTPIIQFLANEFKLDPDSVGLDLNFQTDLNLSPSEVIDLLQRIQDALNFTLLDDQLGQITTIEDLLRIVDPDSEYEE